MKIYFKAFMRQQRLQSACAGWP